MACWHCGTIMIWGGDHDVDDDHSFDVETNFSCPNCSSELVFYRSSNYYNERM